VTRRFGGLGLGLAISRNLAEAHGGRLKAWSAGKDRGATFRLELPLAPSPSTAPADRQQGAGAEHPAPAPALRILLVEDNADTRTLMARLLRRRGHHVTDAAGVADALEVVRGGEAFDLLVSDIGLPDGSGLDLMRALRAARPVPGIALSGYGMEEDLRRSREAGFVAHLTKPIDIPALEAVIREVAAAGAPRPGVTPDPDAD
jgi:CheY-like chemotaxis protein